VITLKELREFTKDMDDETLLGMSYDEEAGKDLLTFQEPNSKGGESLLDIGDLPANANED
jgi:hypothetical protein